MKFSYVTLPDYPLGDSIEMIKTADRLGYHAVYSVDETWHKDPWILFAAAADKTTNIRFGPNLTPIGLREPTLVCQALATLDELTGGRTECVFSIGNFGLLAQYHIDWAKTKPLSRVKEAHHVMRTFLDDGTITYEGDFYKYSGLFTFARPVQERVPLIIGAMRGPKSFQVAGEISDGCHHALSYSKEAYEFLVENVKIGAERAGRELAGPRHRSLVRDRLRPRLGRGQAYRPDDGRLLHLVDAARAARAARHRPGDMAPIVEALGKGELDKALELTSPEVAEKLSIAGTPEECVAKIKEIESTGVNHMILCITDPHIVKAFTQRDVDVPDVNGQLNLIAEQVMPSFN